MNAQKILLGFCSLVLTFSVKAQSWNQVTVPTQEKLNDIQFVDNLVGYIAGDNLTLLKTTDGGINWINLSPQGLPNQGPTDHIQEIEFVDANIGYLTIENQLSVYKTTDGGLNWTAVQNNQTNQCFPVSVYAFAEGEMFTGGSDCFQGATINEYQSPTWTTQTVNYTTWDTQHFVTDLDFNGNLGLAAVNNEYFLRTTDAGATWDSINSNIGNGNVLTSVLIAENDTCYAGYNQNGGGFGILYSDDAGVTWQEDINSATFFYPAYYGGTVNSSGKVYMAAVPSFGMQGLIFEKTGVTWGFESVDQPVYAMDNYGNDVTWAVGDSGYVVVNKVLSTVSAPELDQDMETLSLYPNPTNGILFWDCDSCKEGEVQIFDWQGKLIYDGVVISKQSIDLSVLNSGVYVFQFTSDNQRYIFRFVKE
ncbi:MAG: YCF48-related protein [Fluviicola sp.]